jgi:adenylate kinase family enzyme
MGMHRILIFGNSGSGKTTMAREVANSLSIPYLDLDRITWDPTAHAVRRPLQATIAALAEFIAAHPAWVIEGCYGDLIERAVPYCSELRFLNPGVEACVANCRKRPWEPTKYTAPGDQDARLDQLIAWVRLYETRDDEFSLKRHRMIFDAFQGVKREYR